MYVKQCKDLVVGDTIILSQPTEPRTYKLYKINNIVALQNNTIQVECDIGNIILGGSQMVQFIPVH
jgi:hypothetical protein